MKKITILTMLILLSSCQGKKAEHDYPLADIDKRRKRMGSIVSNEEGGGISLLSGLKKDNQTNIIANNLLWKASLEIMRFMPLQQSDPVGGVILTDWYEDPKAPNERFKINVIISSAELRSDSLKINIFKQILNKKNEWISAIVSEQMPHDLEDKIINKAKQLKISHPIN